jgi:hypothetical protein
MIKPTVGRVLWFTPSVAWATESAIAYGAAGEPLAAIVAHVINDEYVNLSVFDQNGDQFNAYSVPLLDEVPPPNSCYEFFATWPNTQAQPEPVRMTSSHEDNRIFITRDLVSTMLDRGKDSYYIAEHLPRLLDLVYGQTAPSLTSEESRVIRTHTSKLFADEINQSDFVKQSAPPVDHIEQEIQAKGLTAPRITPADIQANIVSEHYFTAAQGDAKAVEDGAFANGSLNGAASRLVPAALGLLTFCVLTLQNGFTVTGESACASPENFNAEIGRKIARENAVQKIWPLMGYELKQRLHEQRVIEPGRAEVVATWIDHNNNRIRHGVECDISKIQDSCIHLERYVNNWQENALKEHATGFQAITTEGT